MKVALVIERMDPSGGGREASTAQIAEALAARGCDVTVLCQQANWSPEGIAIRELGVASGSRLARLRRFAADVQRAADEGDFDIVHSSLPVAPSTVYQIRGGTIPAQRMAGRRRRGPVSAFLHRLGEPFNRVRAAMAGMERRLLAETSVLCAPVSGMVAGELERHYGRTENVRTIFNGVVVPEWDADERRRQRGRFRGRFGLEDIDWLFLSAAKNPELKGFDHAIRSFARWCGLRPMAGSRLVLLGPERSAAYRRLAVRMGVGERVHFEPFTDEMFSWYCAADACLLLSWYDPCSRVVLEATRWGVPCVTTRFNGAAEALAGGAGVVVERPDDHENVAAALADVTNPKLRPKMLAACRDAAEGLSIARHVDELIDAYHGLLNAR